jgi:chemotaxis protein CheY-P-specific phosphatase CheC
MNSETSELWSRIINNPDAQGLLRLAMRHVARDLTDMCGHAIKLHNLQLESVSCEALVRLNDVPEAEIVAVYLSTGDDLPGHALLMLTLEDARYLADWLLELRPGATGRLGTLEYSALAEVGNQALSSFLNILAEFTGVPLHPSPPAVTADILANIMELIMTTALPMADKFLLIKTNFKDTHDSIQIQFWVWPDPSAIKNDRF